MLAATQQLFLQTHRAAGAIVIATVVGSVLVEWAVTAHERAGTAAVTGRAARARVWAATLLETSTARTNEDSSADRGSKRILIGSLVAAIAVGWWLASRGYGPPLPGAGWATVIVGVAVMWCGIGLRAWAIAVLGRFFRRVVTVQREQRVVRSGPYRLIRHPAYTGNLLAAGGFGIVLGTYLSLAALVVIPLLGHLPRIWIEEAELERGLGEEYVAYEANTKRLVPYVW